MSFHALTSCDTVSSFSGYGKKKCWKIFQKQPDSVSSIGRNGELDLIEQFVCRLYGVPTQTDVNQARLHLFVKGRKELDMLPPTRDALDLHCKQANYQARIWLQADQEQIIVPPSTYTFAWAKEISMLSPVWTRLPPIPEACLQLVTCGCKSKCKTVRCSCYKKGLRCTPACGCDAVECCNPAGQ